MPFETSQRAAALSKKLEHSKEVKNGLFVNFAQNEILKLLCFSVFKLQTRHQNGDTHFLTLDEILDETKLLDLSMKQKEWLMNEVCVRPVLPQL